MSMSSSVNPVTSSLQVNLYVTICAFVIVASDVITNVGAIVSAVITLPVNCISVFSSNTNLFPSASFTIPLNPTNFNTPLSPSAIV